MAGIWPSCGHEKTEKTTTTWGSCRVCHNARAADYERRVYGVKKAKRLAERAADALIWAAREIASLRRCPDGHPMLQNDKFCRECAAEEAHEPRRSNSGFSPQGTKTSLDWAIYWDRRVKNAALAFGVRKAASLYGLEQATIVSLLEDEVQISC